MELYRTIARQVSVTQTIEKSRFIAHAKPVKTREEAEEFIDEIRNRFRDATHNVPAMVLGDGMQVQWASDDGEPQGTSGAPIVQLITGEGLTNVVIVVTRYFGGIKLGTGGLVRAYSSSARLALEEAGICSIHEISLIRAVVDYTFLSKLQKMATQPAAGNEGGFTIGEIRYGEKVEMEISCQADNEEKVKELLANLTSGTCRIISVSKDRGTL